MSLIRCTYCWDSYFSVGWCSFVFRVNLTLFYDQVFVLNLPMYLNLFTIAPRTWKQLLTSALTCFRGSHLTLWLLFRVMQVFGCETCSDTRSICLFSQRYETFLVLWVISVCEWLFLVVVALIDDFFDLMLDLFLAGGAIRIRGVFCFGFLFAVEWFK